MSTWTKQKLEDLVDFIDGDRGKQYPKHEEFSDSGDCLFLSTKNVPNTRFDFTEKMFISAEKDSKLRKGKLKRGDYVLTTRGTVGNFAHFGNHIGFENVRINSGMVILRKKSEKLENAYLQYYLMGPSFGGQTKSRVSGSAQPQLPIRDMLSIEVMLPNNETQTRIASVLSAYDDLIGNNEKRIKTLEEMARLLYVEWFVKFKFPGHEKVRLIDSGTQYGKIPEGWGVKKLREFSKLVSRGASLTYVENGGFPVVNQRCVRNGLVRWEAVQYAKPLSARNEDLYLNKYDSLINSMGVGTLGRVSRNLSILGKAIIHNCITLIRTHNPETESTYLYYFVKSKEKHFISLGVGATGQTSLKPETVANLLMLIPEVTILKKYSAAVIPMWDEMALLLQENQNLSKTRDLLIPQLVTGRRELR